MVLKSMRLKKKLTNPIFMYGAILRTVCRVHYEINAVYTETGSRKEIMDLLDRGLH